MPQTAEMCSGNQKISTVRFNPELHFNTINMIMIGCIYIYVYFYLVLVSLEKVVNCYIFFLRLFIPYIHKSIWHLLYKAFSTHFYVGLLRSPCNRLQLHT